MVFLELEKSEVSVWTEGSFLSCDHVADGWVWFLSLFDLKLINLIRQCKNKLYSSEIYS